MQLADSAAFKEFGFVSSESANYRGAKDQGTLNAYRMKDATGALAAWDWLRPPMRAAANWTPYCRSGATPFSSTTPITSLEFRGLSPTQSGFAVPRDDAS